MQDEQYCTPAGSLIYLNSRVHGNRTLYAEAGPYHYKLLLLNCMVPGLLPRREVEEGNSEAFIIVNYYNLLLYNAAATSAALLLYALYELLDILFLGCKTRRKMLVFVRPSFSSLF